MDESSKMKSAVWLADHWELVRARETNVHAKGDPKYDRLSILRRLQQDLHSTGSSCNVTLTFLSSRRGTYFSPIECVWLVTVVEVMFPKLGYKGDRFATWDITGMLALGTSPPCYMEAQVTWRAHR